MSSRLRSLTRRVKSLVSRRNTIRAVEAPIRSVDTWVRITRPGSTTIYWNPVRHTSTFAVPDGDIVVENDRLYRMYMDEDDAINARIIARRRQANSELANSELVDLTELGSNTDRLRREYDNLYAHYVRVCKSHDLTIEELEDTCPECLCGINGEVMMFPVSIRNQHKAYEQYTITEWFNKGRPTDPLRKAKGPLTVGDLKPNSDIKNKIEKYKKLMQDTINKYPLPSDALNSTALASGLRRRKTKRRRRKQKKA